MNTPTVYIAGPMSKMPDHNFPVFHAAAKKWREAGWRVINPAELDGAEQGGPDDRFPRDFYLRRDLAALTQCHAIALLPGWQVSEGAKLEHAVALGLGLKVFDAFWVSTPPEEHDYINGMNVCCDRPDYCHFPSWSGYVLP